jgi:hypothetical protein
LSTVDYWLGDRGEGKVTDFDGHPRACRLVQRIPAGERTYLRLRVSPPLPISEGANLDEIVVLERYLNTDIRKLDTQAGSTFGTGWVPVYVYRIADDSRIRQGVIEHDALVLEYAWAELARTLEQLPPTQEQYFDESFGMLERFAAREGHTKVPQDYSDDGKLLGVWVANIRFEQANLGLRRDWVERLEELPGWRWLPGTDFYLLQRFARREGQTHPALDYEEEGRPLGRWIEDVRDTYTLGRLSKDWIQRLEAIPHWDWN